MDHNELWKVLKEMEIPRNLYAGQEATVRTGQGIKEEFKLGKEHITAVHGHPAYLTSMQSTS